MDSKATYVGVLSRKPPLSKDEDEGIQWAILASLEDEPGIPVLPRKYLPYKRLDLLDYESLKLTQVVPVPTTNYSW